MDASQAMDSPFIRDKSIEERDLALRNEILNNCPSGGLPSMHRNILCGSIFRGPSCRENDAITLMLVQHVHLGKSPTLVAIG